MKPLVSIVTPMFNAEKSLGGEYEVDSVFSIERLKRMGFIWNNRMEKEIDDALLLYSGSRR